MSPWNDVALRLNDVLAPFAEPIGILFATKESGTARLDGGLAQPTTNGRTGQVEAGCVFWVKAVDALFSTTAEDHGNCSVGSFTHGFLPLNEAATKEDVAALVGAEWVAREDFSSVEHVKETPVEVIYGPLAAFDVDPDVILLRINAKALMICRDALPGLRIEGKPQCHIVAIAKESKQVAASVGCMLSRTRTGMGADEMTLAIPAEHADSFLSSLERTAGIDATVASYAATDAMRFA